MTNVRFCVQASHWTAGEMGNAAAWESGRRYRFKDAVGINALDENTSPHVGNELRTTFRAPLAC